MYECYGVGKKKKKKGERTREKNLVSYRTDVALFFFITAARVSCLHIYDQNFKINETFANSNSIDLMNNTFIKTKKRQYHEHEQRL
jgi:hypothetical protein